VAAEFVDGKRVRYVHPLRYYVLVLAGSALIVAALGNTLLLALPLLAGLLRLFFRRSRSSPGLWPSDKPV